MGVIRKTVSISTLGIVPFRSRKELLKRAEKDRKAAEAELDREQAARLEADRRVAAAEKRVQRAELVALHETKVAAKAKAKGKGKGRRRGRRARRTALERFGDLVEGAQPVVEEQAKAVGRRARRAAKASRHAAQRAQREASRGGRRARARMQELEATMAPHVEAAAGKAQALREDLTERAQAAAAQVKEKASELVDEKR